MKIITSSLLTMLVILMLPLAQGQSLKRLKQRVEQKVENKVERKIDQKIDKVLDRAFEGNPDKDRQQDGSESRSESREGTRNKDFGDARISHPNHPLLNVGDLGEVKVTSKGSYHKIYGSWWTHEADILDGFVIEIFDAKTIRSDDSPTQMTFKIPEEASLKLGYDFSKPVEKAPEDDKKRAVTDDYMDYQIPSGEVTISVLDKGQIKFSYTGPGGMQGNVVAESPRFMAEDVVRKKEKTRSNNPLFGNSSSGSSTSGSSATPASEYTFTTEIVNKITQDGSKDVYEMSFFLNPNESYVGMGADMGKMSQGDVEGESLIVMDEGNVFIFVTSSGMKLLMTSMPGQDQKMNTDQMAEYDYTNIRKTGASKKIMGYTCYEYKMSDNSTTMEFWAAPDFDLPNWFVQQSGAQQTPIEGYIMEYHIDSPDGNSSSTTIDIKENIGKKIISSTYTKMF